MKQVDQDNEMRVWKTKPHEQRKLIAHNTAILYSSHDLNRSDPFSYNRAYNRMMQNVETPEDYK